MNRLIVYQSQTGFTRQYALWIAEALRCPARSVQSVTFQELSASELLIYGGWIMSNKIQGLDNLAKKRMGHLAIFAVGASGYSEKLLQTLREVNMIPSAIPLFYLQGGIHPEQLSVLQQMALSVMGHTLRQRENRNPAEDELLQLIEHGGNRASIQAIQPLLEALDSPTALQDYWSPTSRIS